MFPLLVAALLGACGLFIVLAPLFAPGRAHQPATGEIANGLVEREAAAKMALRDVEFDHQLGNLAEDDYRSLRERYMRRALAAMKGRYDQEHTVDDVIEMQVRALREADAAKAAAQSRASKPLGAPATQPARERRTASAPSAGVSARKRAGGAKRSKGSN